MSTTRLAVACILVAATCVIAARAHARGEGAGVVESRIPLKVADWEGVEAAPLDAETERALGADLVVNRTYHSSDGVETGLYVAYYAHQRPGVSIHSPLHCLPGTGWDVMSNDVVNLGLPDGRTGAVRRLVAQKASTRVMILYWYDIQGRMIANDFLSRLYLLNGRIRSGRNEAALVRLVVPADHSLPAAQDRGLAFARALLPYL